MPKVWRAVKFTNHIWMGDLTPMHREQKTSVRDVCLHKKKGSCIAFMNNGTVRGYANQLSRVTRKENLEWSVIGGQRNDSALKSSYGSYRGYGSVPITNMKQLYNFRWLRGFFFFFFAGGPRGLFWLLQWPVYTWCTYISTSTDK